MPSGRKAKSLTHFIAWLGIKWSIGSLAVLNFLLYVSKRKRVKTLIQIHLINIKCMINYDRLSDYILNTFSVMVRDYYILGCSGPMRKICSLVIKKKDWVKFLSTSKNQSKRSLLPNCAFIFMKISACCI